MIKAATVSIVQDDAFSAGSEVAQELSLELGGDPDLVVVFASSKYDQAQVLAGLWSRLPPTVKLVGSSSHAEINSEEALMGSVTAMGLRLGGVACETFEIRQSAPGAVASLADGVAFGAKVKAFEPDLLILFADSLTLHGTQFLLGVQTSLGPRFPIIGGMSSDADFSHTSQLHGREALTGGAVGVALKGKIELVTAAKAGWYPIGAKRICTKVDGKAILELDGRPALALYKEFLGDRAREMPGVGIEFPLGVVGGVSLTQRLPEGEEVLFLRAVIGVDEARDALLCVGDVPVGTELCMTRAGRDNLLRAADEAGEAAASKMADPAAAFVFACTGRKFVLGARYKEELQGTLARLADVPKIGFYTFGELSPVDGVTMYHDETFTVALLRGD